LGGFKEGWGWCWGEKRYLPGLKNSRNFCLEGSKMNNFKFCSNFKIGTYFELKNLKWFEFLNASNHSGKFQEIHENSFLATSSRI
jgi:hypothetical protein